MYRWYKIVISYGCPPVWEGEGAQWLSGRVLDSRSRGRGKTRPFITEKLLMGRKESNKTKTCLEENHLAKARGLSRRFHVQSDKPCYDNFAINLFATL